MINILYEPFRHWSETGSVYLFSDPHFDDPECSRMDPDWITPRRQIEIINSLAGKSDTIVLLGDIGNPIWLTKLRAKQKILLLGNHDARTGWEEYFTEVYSGPLFIAEKILLSHEPVTGLPWCVNIHGHDHSNTALFPENCRHINVAANVCGYTPVNLGKLIKEGLLSDIPTIHRVAIDHAIARKQQREKASSEE